MTRDDKKLLIGLLHAMNYQDYKSFEVHFTMLLSTIYMKSDSALVRGVVARYIPFLMTMDGSLMIKSLMKNRSLYNVFDEIQAGVIYNDCVKHQICQVSRSGISYKNGCGTY